MALKVEVKESKPPLTNIADVVAGSVFRQPPGDNSFVKVGLGSSRIDRGRSVYGGYGVSLKDGKLLGFTGAVEVAEKAEATVEYR